MEELVLYTVRQLKDWLYCNVAIKGLSEQVITRQRACSICNNPWVTDDMPVSSALFVDGELAAYTAAFPEMPADSDRLCYWFTTLHVFPEFEGRGYGVIVIGSLMESYDTDNIYDSDPVHTSVLIFNRLGLTDMKFPLYTLSHKSIHATTLRGRVAKALYNCRSGRYARPVDKRVRALDVRYGYSAFIDDDLYAFMQNCSVAGTFRRSKEFYNWALRYPFRFEAPVVEKVPTDQMFTSIRSLYRYYVVDISKDNRRIGMMILCNSSDGLKLEYLAFVPEEKENVYLAVFEHIRRFDNVSFITTDADLAAWLNATRYFIHYRSRACNLVVPPSFAEKDVYLQGGDGDMFFN